jgi:hypothetical protein
LIPTRSNISFDPSRFPATFESVHFSVFCNHASGGGAVGVGTVYLYLAGPPGGVGGWFEPTPADGPLVFVGGFTVHSNTMESFDVTPAVRQLIAAGTSEVRVHLWTPLGGWVQIQFASSQSPDHPHPALVFSEPVNTQSNSLGSFKGSYR